MAQVIQPDNGIDKVLGLAKTIGGAYTGNPALIASGVGGMGRNPGLQGMGDLGQTISSGQSGGGIMALLAKLFGGSSGQTQYRSKPRN